MSDVKAGCRSGEFYCIDEGVFCRSPGIVVYTPSSQATTIATSHEFINQHICIHIHIQLLDVHGV